MAHEPIDPSSTYTSVYEFEKAILGAYVGRWHALINDNLDLIDAAIAGKSDSDHNHDSDYLGITAKAADSDKLDGSDSTAFAAASHDHDSDYEPVITTLAIAKGGTGTGTAPTSGKLLIGKADGSYTPATLTEGDNITITEGDGSITIAATGGGDGDAAPVPGVTATDLAGASIGAAHPTLFGLDTFTPEARAAIMLDWANVRYAQKLADWADWKVVRRNDLLSGTEGTDWFDATDNAYHNITTAASDQSATLTALIADLPVGAVLFFPAGTYRFQTQVNFSKEITVLGEESTVFDCSYCTLGDMYPLFTINSAGTPRMSNVLISGIQFTGPGVGTSPTMLMVKDVDGFVFERCKVYNWGYSALDIWECNDAVVQDCVFDTVFSLDTGYSIDLRQKSDRTVIRRNFFVNRGRHYITTGYAKESETEDNYIREILIEDNLFHISDTNRQQQGDGEALVDTHANAHGPIIIRNNVFYNPNYMVQIRGCVRECYIEENVGLGCVYGFRFWNQDITTPRPKIDRIINNVVSMYVPVGSQTNCTAQAYDLTKSSAVVSGNVSLTTANGPRVYLPTGTYSYIALRNNVYGGPQDRWVEGGGTPTVNTGNTYDADLDVPGTGATIIRASDGWDLVGGAAPEEEANPYINEEVLFNGSSDKYVIGTKADFKFLHAVGTTGKWSMSGYARVNNFTSFHVLFSTAALASGLTGISVYVNTSRELTLAIYNGVSGQTYMSDYGGLWPDDALWHHFVITFDATATPVCQMYIDRVSLGSAGKDEYEASTADSDYDPTLGATGSGAYYWDGAMYDFKVFKDMLIDPTTGGPK